MLTNILNSPSLKMVKENVPNQPTNGWLSEAEKSERAKDFLITLIFYLVAYQFLLGFLMEHQVFLEDKSFLDVLNPLMMILVGIGAYFKIANCVLPKSEYGLNLQNWRHNVKEALQWTVYFIIGLILFKCFLVQFIPYYQNKPVFDFSILGRFTPHRMVLIYVSYALLVPVQEFVARGVIQGSLEHFLTGKNRIPLAILLSNMMFGAFHIHYDTKFALLTMMAGIFWGILYTRQKSILGVTISHTIIGLFTLLCMGLV